MKWIVLIGVVAGMRTMTPIAVLSWFVWLNRFQEPRWGAWVGLLPVVILLTVAALAEYVVDILPQTPSRKETPLVITRFVFGVLAGVLAWRGIGEPVVGGVLMALVGVPIGIYGGYRMRMALARKFGRDWPAGLLESAMGLAVTLYGVDSLHWALIKPAVALLHGLHCGVLS
ncbi:MAG: DUF4126 domain-containing protein [Acidobacteriota bacterium]